METAPPREVFDRQAALERVEGDTELLEEVTQLFLDSSPKLLSQIGQAVSARDAQALNRAAHTLKGSVANLAADAAFQAAFRLEKIGRQGRLDDAEEAYAALQLEMQRLLQVLISYVE